MSGNIYMDNVAHTHAHVLEQFLVTVLPCSRFVF